MADEYEHSVDLEDLQSPSAQPLSEAERVHSTYTSRPVKLVRINVGGTCFTTFSSTLTAQPDGTRLGFFDGLLSGRVPAVMDDTGAYFIDRNPEVFAVVLDYLRNGRLYIPAAINERRLIAEFDFFGIEYPSVRQLDAEQVEYHYLWAMSATNQRGVLFEMQLCLSKMRGSEPTGYLTSKSSKTGLSEVLTNVVFSVATSVVQFYRPALDEWYHGSVAVLGDEASLSGASFRSMPRTVAKTRLAGHFMCRDEARTASFGSWHGEEIPLQRTPTFHS